MQRGWASGKFCWRCFFTSGGVCWGCFQAKIRETEAVLIRAAARRGETAPYQTPVSLSEPSIDFWGIEHLIIQKTPRGGISVRQYAPTDGTLPENGCLSQELGGMGARSLLAWLKTQFPEEEGDHA